MKSVGAVLWLLTMAALGAWISVMAWDRDPPYLYLGAEAGSKITCGNPDVACIDPHPALPEAMVSTDWILSEVERDCPRTVERIFSDRATGKVVTTLDATPLSRVVRSSATSLSRSFNLPPSLPPHIDYYVITRFECNVLHHLFPFTRIEIVSPKLPIDIRQ